MIRTNANGLSVGGMLMAMPIVVVPDGRLWCVHYHEDGSMAASPKKKLRCSLYTGNHAIPINDTGPNIFISHIEFMTISGLRDFVSHTLSNENTMRRNLFGALPSVGK